MKGLWTSAGLLALASAVGGLLLSSCEAESRDFGSELDGSNGTAGANGSGTAGGVTTAPPQDASVTDGNGGSGGGAAPSPPGGDAGMSMNGGGTGPDPMLSRGGAGGGPSSVLPGSSGEAGDTGIDGGSSGQDGGVGGAGLDAGASADGGLECLADEKLCDGICVDMDDPAYGCGPTTCDGTTCPSQSTGASVVCEDGACVIDECPDDYKQCDDICVAVSDPTYGCGATTCDESACPTPGAGTLVCEDGACVIGECGAGTKLCGDRCVTTDANNGCEEATRCTACANDEACVGSPSSCECVPTALTLACAGRNCGTVPDGCGGNHTCGGSCTSPNTCGGDGTPNVCGCAEIPMATACAGQSCGTASDGCGGNYTCGSCSAPTSVCVANECEECVSISDCPSGTFNCSNNTCMCRAPNSANVIKDGGFDDPSTLSSWTSSQASWSTDDADGCPASGSVQVDGPFSRCFQVPLVPAGGVEYSLGMISKSSSNAAGCFGGFYQDSNCTQPAGGANFLNLGGGGSSTTWTPSVARSPAPEGTRSILVECGSFESVRIDQIYLRVTGPAGSGF